MSLLFVFLCLFNQGTVDHRQDHQSVRIFVVSQTNFKNRGHHPLHNRRVIFKMVNESNQAATVYGTKFDDGFEPAGYIISLDENTGQWAYPNPSNSPISWNERSDADREKLTLLPGESITLEAEMSQLEVGMRFKRTAYVSFRGGEEPHEIRGEEFVLK